MKDRIEQAIDVILNEMDKEQTGLWSEVGVTQKSLDNAKKLVAKKGNPVSVQLSFTDQEDWYTVRAVWPDDSFHNFKGFSWGYRGEGPHGLAEFFKMIGVPIDLDDIASWTRDIKKTIDVPMGD